MANPIKRNFPVLGMGCASCALSIQGALKSVPGVLEASVSLASNMAQVEYDPALVSTEVLKKAVDEAGYELVVPAGGDDSLEGESLAEEEAESLRAKTYKRTVWDMRSAIIVAVAELLLEFGIVDFNGKGLVMFLLAAVAVLWCGRSFIVNALKQASHFRAGMDSLVALSTGISLLFSSFNLIFPEVWTSRGLEAKLYFGSCSVVVAFVLIGRLLEEKAKFGTTASIRKLMDLQPRRQKAEVGDVVKIKPGQRIGVDGVVVEGESFVDESLLTGEPLPAEKRPGSHVFSGTMNRQGVLQVKVEKTGDDTMLSEIIRMVKNAQGSKARIQGIVDKVAAVFVPVVILISLACLVGWSFVPEAGFVKGLLCMVSVLVVACPCSLGLATPTAIIAGIGRGAQEGILIKDADTLQLAGRCKAVVLDKTGTLTVGRPVVVEEWWGVGGKAKAVLKAIEMNSEHPVAPAILDKLAGVEAAKLQYFRAVPGKGAEAGYGGQVYFVGNTSPEPSERAEEWKEAGRTVAYFSCGDNLLAMFAIADEPKVDSAEAIFQLKRLGITSYMLTGDNEKAALSMAEKVGISKVSAAALPADKARFVKDLQAKKGRVVMVGDGINDSAALACADVGVAMGKGSDIAMDAAMVTLVSSDLSKLPKLVALSRASRRIIWENLGWAFVYNVVAIPAAAGLYGFMLNPMASAAAMACSSLLVVTNSLRLRRIRLDSRS